MPDTVPASRPTVEDLYASKAEFDTASTRVGTATGTGFSGTYSLTAGPASFSIDCTVPFVRANDFYVNSGAPDAELQQRLDSGLPGGSLSLTLTQTDGRIVADSPNDGIESAFAGPIDSDGSFEAFVGAYVDPTDFGIARYRGRVVGTTVQASFVAQLKDTNDATTPGSCSLVFEID